MLRFLPGTSLPGCEKIILSYLPSSVITQPNEVILWNNVDDVAHAVASGSPGRGALRNF